MIDQLRARLTISAKPVKSRRSIWLFAFLAAVIAYVALLTHYESQIADVETQIADIEGIVSSDALFARAQPHLTARRDGILAHLHAALSNDLDDSSAIGAFLRDTHDIALRNGVTVVTLGQDLNAPAPTPAPARPAAMHPPAGAPVGLVAPARLKHARVAPGPRPFDSAFVAIPFNLKLAGGYTPLLRTIEQLADSTVLVRVESVALSSPGTASRMGLVADVHVTVFRPMPSAAALARGS